MSDQRVRADLRDFAPDPLLDTEGFLLATAERALREIEAAHKQMSPRQFHEWMLLRALARMAQSITSNHPRPVQELQARGVVRNLAAWSAFNETPDGRSRA